MNKWAKRVEKSLSKKKAVFCTFITSYKEKVFNNNKDFQKTKFKDIEVYKLTVFFRHDLKFGFIGGSVEQNETIEEALLREIKEEVYGLEKKVKTLLEKNNYDVLIHTNGKLDTILYVFKLNKKEFEKIVKIILKGIFKNNKNNEIVGLNLFFIYPNLKDWLYNFSSYPTPSFFKEEMVCILKNYLKKEVFEEFVKINNIPECVYKYC